MADQKKSGGKSKKGKSSRKRNPVMVAAYNRRLMLRKRAHVVQSCGKGYTPCMPRHFMAKAVRLGGCVHLSDGRSFVRQSATLMREALGIKVRMVETARQHAMPLWEMRTLV